MQGRERRWSAAVERLLETALREPGVLPGKAELLRDEPDRRPTTGPLRRGLNPALEERVSVDLQRFDAEHVERQRCRLKIVQLPVGLLDRVEKLLRQSGAECVCA